MRGEYAGRFGLVYGALAVYGVAAIAAFFIILSLPRPDVHQQDLKPLATKAQLQQVAGDQDLVAQCEANLTQQVDNAGGKVRTYSNPKVTHLKNKALVKVKLTADIYTGVVTCSFGKSNWQLSNVTAA